MTMRVYQVIENLAFGDAIGNYTLFLNDILEEAGFETRIYAENIGKRIDMDKVSYLKELPELYEDDLVIYQMCQSSKLTDILKKIRCKKACIYHNITPPEFFEAYDTSQAAFQRKGMLEVKSLNHTFDYVFGVSKFDCQDLIKMGYDRERTEVLPLIVPFDDYKTEPDKTIVDKYSDDWVNILFVGRVSPNKKQEDIIRIFAFYKKYVNPKSRLFLVGSFFNEKYRFCLKKYVKELEIEDVYFTDQVKFSEILAYYSCADIFCCMSEHEGFCVPLLEAMMFEKPIVAFDSSAIGETLGGSGVLMDSKDPCMISMVFKKIQEDHELRERIIKEQNERLEYFSLENLKPFYVKKFKDIEGDTK